MSNLGTRPLTTVYPAHSEPCPTQRRDGDGSEKGSCLMLIDLFITTTNLESNEEAEEERWDKEEEKER